MRESLAQNASRTSPPGAARDAATIPPTTPPQPGSCRTELARGCATTAPPDIDTGPTVEHGLRHLAWLIRDDPVVGRALPPAWHDVLAGYVPEPFRHL